MTTWNAGGPGYYPPPPGDPNQGYYGGQPGYPPPQQPYPGAMPAGPYPGAYPPPGAGFPPGAPPAGFVPPPYAHNPGGEYPGAPPQQPGKQENTPLNYAQHGLYGGSSNYHDPEADDVKGFDFNDRSIRNGFIRKVYAILMIQLALTFGCIALFLYHKPTRFFVHKHPELFWIAIVVMIVTLISMSCCSSVRRKAPMNYIFLTLFTSAEAFMLSIAASSYDEQSVLLAVGITAVVCLGLTIFAFQTKWDFTVMGGALLVCMIVLMLFGLIAIFVRIKILTIVYAAGGAILFSLYLLYDTQLMLGGKHKYSISPEEYIFAALNLYLDVVQIFMHILTLVGAARD